MANTKNEYFGGRKYNFLVVDDEPGIREVIKIMLEKEGHKVKTASNGNECIKELSPDTELILLDIKMPDSNSKEIIGKVSKKNPKTRIIYITSVTAFEPTEIETEMGWEPELTHPVIGYISKPFTKEILFKKIEEAINRYEKVGKMRN